MTDVNALMRCKTVVCDMRIKKTEDFKELLEAKMDKKLFITSDLLLPGDNKSLLLNNNDLLLLNNNKSSNNNLLHQPAAFRELFGSEGLLAVVANISGVNHPDFLTGYYFAHTYLPKIFAIAQIENEVQLDSLHIGFNGAAQLIDGINVYMRRKSSSLLHKIHGVDKKLNASLKENFYVCGRAYDVFAINDLYKLRRDLAQIYGKKLLLMTADVKSATLSEFMSLLLIALEFVDRRGIILLRFFNSANDNNSSNNNESKRLLLLLQYYFENVHIFQPPWCDKTYVCLSGRSQQFGRMEAMSYSQKLRRGAIILPELNDTGSNNDESNDELNNDESLVFTEESAYEFVLSLFEL